MGLVGRVEIGLELQHYFGQRIDSELDLKNQ